MRIIDREGTIATIRTLVETGGYRDWPSTTEYEEFEPLEEGGSDDHDFTYTYISPDQDLRISFDSFCIEAEILSDSTRRYDPHTTIVFRRDETLEIEEIVWRKNGKIID